MLVPFHALSQGTGALEQSTLPPSVGNLRLG